MAIVDSRSRARRMHVDDPRVKRLLTGAVVWTAVMLPVMLFAPLGTMSTSTIPDGGGASVEVTERVSVFDSDGLGPLPYLLGFLALTLVALAWGRRSRTAIVVPALFYDLGILLAILSVGIFFAPAGIALTIAAISRRD